MYLPRPDPSVRAFRIAYDGRPFSGFQRQPDVPTVEDAIFDALEALGVADLPRTPDGGRPRPPGYAAAGRTDAGVSAAAQTIALDVPDWLTPRAFNGQLPKHVRAWAAADVPDDFHARHDASARTYRYHLYAPTAAIDDSPAAVSSLDDGRVHDALERLSGTHDFHNLTPDDGGTERTLDASARREGDLLVVRARADGFPREFVRRLVTLVRAIGTGDAPPSRIDRVLASEPLDGPRGIAPAPATPLVLWNVEYGSETADLDGTVRFEVDQEAAESAFTAFREESLEARRTAAALDSVRDRIDGDFVDT